MKRNRFFLALVIALALVSIALVGSGSAGLDASVAPTEATILSGGHYQLSGTIQSQSQPLASGGSYQLSAPASSENGCCCMFLPCVSK